ncbi:uncharacterized protein KY384_007639 [Bacidia gigantensis]|uniref:uncharacterized protein n=1 Tax=Bacidia gigantensis TaxID=2732470 RepID=UPI001D04C523|nr:uncharacterized protein KY384_007639 [Bacidia gigantensis]KAG8527487.1 hypothetical protein KY384_007639 [Bacidia gigantensis]
MSQSQGGQMHREHRPRNVHDGRLPHRSRLPNVEQALRFSPFSSVVPFNVDVVPMPDARTPGFPSLFANVSEQEKAEQQLRQLNEQSTSTLNRSSSAERIKKDLQRLIDPDDITDLYNARNFKAPVKLYRNEKNRKSQTNGYTNPTTPKGLGPLASSVFHHTSSSHRYPTPTSFKKQSSAAASVTAPHSSKTNSLQPATGLPTPQVVIPAKSPNAHFQPARQDGFNQIQSHNQAVFNQQASSEATSHTSPTLGSSLSPHPAPSQVSYKTPSKPAMIAKAVHLPYTGTTSAVNGHYFASPAFPVESNTSDHHSVASNLPNAQQPANGNLTPNPQTPTYRSTNSSVSSLPKSSAKPMVVIPASTTHITSSDYVTLDLPSPEKVSRKRKRGFGVDAAGHAPEMKDQKAAADATLQQFTELTEEIFEAEDQSQQNLQVFIQVRLEDRDLTTLTPALHGKIDAYLQKIISYGRFSEIAVDDLLRLHTLSEGAIYSVENQDLDFNSEWTADGFESWVERLETANLSLRSARTILRTMTGAREEKQVYSEDLLLAIVKMIQKITDGCVIPVVETRNSSDGNLFEHLSTHKKPLSHILHEANKVLILIARILSKQEMAEMIMTAVEFFAIRLMFVENASSEKESALGIQKYETLRRTAMDMIAIIFSRYPSQRTFLFDEILTSLQRLPTGRQAARQFRLKDGRPIQLVTALIIQLVQTSSTVAKSPRPVQTKTTATMKNGTSGEASEKESESTSESDSSDTSEGSSKATSESLRKLRHKAMPLCAAAAKSAQHVVGYLMQRAQTSSKSGDEPHRQLLDIFVEDLLLVLGLSDWPGAELLLRAVCARAIHILDTPKSLAPAKNMALELLGTMGSAISDLVAHTRTAVQSLENHDSKFSGYLTQMFEDYTEGSLEPSELLLWNGPYHAVVEQYEQAPSDDLQAMSAQSYYLAQWAKAVCTVSPQASPAVDKLATRHYAMLSGEEWVTSEDVQSVSAGQSQVAYALTILNMDFCRHFDYMLKLLIDSVTSEQTTVRSRGLRSVTQMLEKDPSILDRARNVKNVILKCATDTSPMVRDAALALISKCIALKPALEVEFLNHVLRLSNDSAVGVRKRSMKLLRDIYLRNASSDIKAAISDSLLQRAQDNDPGVVDLARQTFEEVWIAPFWSVSDSVKPDAETEIALRRQILLIIKTASRNPNVPPVLVLILKQLLSSDSKNATANAKVCTILVRSAFDLMIDSAQSADTPEQRHILETITIFAKANPRLFDSDQLQILQPYIGNLNSLNDLNIFRPVVVIFRFVLPVLSSVEQGMLESIQTSLLKGVSRLSKAELSEVAECLWAINGSLKRPDPLIKLIASVIKNLRQFATINFSDNTQKDNMLRVKKYIQIAGFFGKHCDFEAYRGAFQTLLPGFKEDSVASLIVQSLSPFTTASQPLNLQALAYDSVGLICQSWPYQFTKPSVSKAFASVLQRGQPELQEIVLSNFRDFFTGVEHQSVSKPEDDATSEDASAPKLGSSMTANERDSASALISQHFLKDILGIALASQDLSALTASEVIASINRQGLAHPKESGPALVALGTSSNAAIAQVAFEEHRILHTQHESMFEREYMRAIYEAFRYQKDVVKDPLGFSTQPLTAKLAGMWDIIKTSKAKYQKKFLSNYCAKIDFDLERLDMSEDISPTLQFARFLLENLAFFDYSRLDELLHALACMERIVGGTGSAVAHHISTEVFHIVVESAQDTDARSQNQAGLANGEISEYQANSQPQLSSQGTKEPVDPARLKKLTSAAVILASLWEARTYLRRLYGQSANQQRRENGKSKGTTKDLSKAPTRIQGVSGEKLVSTIAEKVASLNSEEAMIRACEEFVELMSVDNEVKVSAESEGSLGDRPETPGLDDDEDDKDTPMSGASRSLKRKGSGSATNTPSKRRGRPPLNRRKSSSRKSVDGDDADDDWK